MLWRGTTGWRESTDKRWVFTFNDFKSENLFIFSSQDAYKQVECPTCHKRLKKWYYHQFHKKTCSSGNVIYQCEICGKEGFINAVTLQNHVRTKHSADRPFTCEYCPSKYATAMSLSGHRSRKHGVNSRGEVVPKKMFPCDHCGKLLTSKMKLQAHIEVIHEGRRDFKCRFCDKTFTSKSNLQIHEGSLHTGVLPYRCDFCQKMFARRSQLTAHKESQHPGHAGPFFVVEDVDSVQVKNLSLESVMVKCPTLSLSNCCSSNSNLEFSLPGWGHYHSGGGGWRWRGGDQCWSRRHHGRRHHCLEEMAHWDGVASCGHGILWSWNLGMTLA